MRRVVLALSVASTACSVTVSRRPIDHTVWNEPKRSLTLHADTGFRPFERKMIDEATASITTQTAGLVYVNAVYDLDFEDTLSIVRLRDQDMLIRAPEDASYVTYEDSDDSMLLGIVKGIDLDNYDPWAPKRVYVVADRLKDHDTFVHVVIHEVYHALGLRHVDERSSVMFAETIPPVLPLCINLSDTVELCRVIGCTIDRVNYCD